jgi:tetratricopeptide (TPR) repeat protein
LAKVEKEKSEFSVHLPTGVSRGEIVQQVESIIASSAFNGAARSRSFLRFIVSKLLEHRLEQIKEYTIAIEAFGMQESFDPRCNPIVRVEAGRLRKKLHSYYRKEGKQAPLIIEVPKGSYAPVIRKGHTAPIPVDSFDHVTNNGNGASFSFNRGSLGPSAEDQAHARGLARLAHFHVSQCLQGVAAPRLLMPQAEFAAQESLRCDGSTFQAHLALGLIHLYYHRNCGLTTWHLDRARQLAPHDVETLNWQVHACLVLSGPQEALPQIEQVLLYQPHSTGARCNLTLAMYLLRAYDQAVYYAEQLVHEEPQFFWGQWILGASYGEQFQDEKAIKCMEAALKLSAQFPPLLAWLGHFCATRAMTTRAEYLVSELLRISTQKYVSPATIALGHLALGDYARAIKFLERAVAAKDTYLVYLNLLPCFSVLQSENRFGDLVNALTLGGRPAATEPSEARGDESVADLER